MQYSELNLDIPLDVQRRVLSYLGFPVITEKDLEITFSFVQELAIWPAMREYFTYFPLIDTDFLSVGSASFEFPFPNQFVYGVTDARVHPSHTSGTASSSNPFIAERHIREAGNFSGSVGMYGTRNDYGMSSVIPLVRAAHKARMVNSKRFRFHVDERNKKISGFTNMPGSLEVSWASFSDNWSDIKMVYEEDVISLSAANTLTYFGRLRGQEQSDLPMQFDSSEFIDTGRQLREDVMDRWRRATKVSLTRK